MVQRAQEESQTQRDEVVEHFNGKLDDFEGRFSAAYKTDMETMAAELEKIPTRIRMTAMSAQGAEVRSLQKYMNEEGADVEDRLDAIEKQYVEAHPEALAQQALIRAAEADVSSKYRKENPFKAAMFDAGKAAVLPQLEAMFLGTSSLKGDRKGNATNPYGL